MKNVKRAYFTYPVADALLEAATISPTPLATRVWNWW